MKILVITKWMVQWNGMSRVVYELSRRFKREHEVRIAVYGDYINPEWGKEFEIYKLRHRGLFALKEIRTIMKEYNPDIIHSHDWLGLLSSFSNTPHVATTHGHWPMNWFFNWRTFVGGIIQEIPHEVKLHLADEVISVSEYGQRLVKNRGIKSEVIYNGIDDGFFKPSKKDIKLNHPAILFVGGFDSGKAGYLIPFIKLLNQKNQKVYTYAIGAPVNKNLVKKLKNLDNTHYLGVVDDVKPYYWEADVLISTSKMEMFGLVVVEAQASGSPVVAFDACSFPEIIKDGKTGFLVEMGDLDGMVDKTLKILNDANLREKMGINGIENVKDRFLWDDKAKVYLELFKRLVR